jgi:iron complex transport system ATP-binding protein
MVRTPVFETSGLTIGYKQKRGKHIVVHDTLNLQLFAGELTGLLGLNGTGKSTLLRTLGGFQPALDGNIRLNDRLLSGYSHTELSRMTGVVLTEKTNAGGMTVRELVTLGRHPYTGFFGVLKMEDKRIVTESITAVGMTHKAGCPVSELSDGERQKAMIAKALAQQCPVILLDEPTAYLDITSRIETMSLLRRLALEQQKAILLSTHDLELAIQMCDCLWLLGEKRPKPGIEKQPIPCDEKRPMPCDEKRPKPCDENHSILCGTPEDLILSGAFETFFDKKGFLFDAMTGKLTADKPAIPIAVEGDPITVHWVGNALIRNGFRPSTIHESNIRIYCRTPRHFSLFLPDTATEILSSSIAELLTALPL